MPRARLTTTVSYGANLAKFSDHDAAHAFAREQSRTGGMTEVSNKTGLVGQYEGGKATPEFAHIDEMNPNLVPHEPMTYAALVSDARGYFQDGLMATDSKDEDELREVMDEAIGRAIPIYNNVILEILMSDIAQGYPDDHTVMQGAEDIYEAARASLRESLKDELRGDLDQAVEDRNEEEEEGAEA
jgi:hypothetical protein